MWGGDTLPRIAFNLLKDTAVYDSHLSSLCVYVCVCVCVCVCVFLCAYTCRHNYFSLVGVGVQVALYCNIAPTVCNSTSGCGSPAAHVSHKNAFIDKQSGGA